MKRKPCPFCGSDESKIATAIQDELTEWHTVECLDCRVSTPDYTSEKRAVDFWNTRIDPKGGRNEVY